MTSKLSLKSNAPSGVASVIPDNWGKGSMSRRRLLGLVGFGILLAALFAGPLFSAIPHIAASNLHSYILLVPFVSAYLIYIRRDRLPKTYDSSLLLAGMSAAGGFIALILGYTLPGLGHNDYLTLRALSFFFFIICAGFLFLGRKWMSAAAFPVAFLIFIVPMPDAMADALEKASQFASAFAANLFFTITRTPVLHDGIFFQLPNIAIQVGQECSGIRSSWILLITSLLAANLFLESRWRRIFLVLFVIPLGILRNGFRVWTIGTLCIDFGPQMIHSIIHRHGGPFFFALSLIPLFLLLWWLRRGETNAQKSEVSGRQSATSPDGAKVLNGT